MPFFSEALDRIKPSPTIAMSNLAAELQAAGRDIISMSAGEPDFDTPTPIKEAAKAAMDAGHTKYTAVDGIPALKAAIVRKFKRDNGLEYTPQQISVGTGGKQILFNVGVTVEPGEIVILTGPSGSGKTTLLTLIGALRSAQEGSVRVLGRELKSASQRQLVKARRRIGAISSARSTWTAHLVTGAAIATRSWPRIGLLRRRRVSCWPAVTIIGELARKAP